MLISFLMIAFWVLIAMATGDMLIIYLLIGIYGAYFMWKLLIWWIDVSVKEEVSN